jgi:cytochrome P450
MRAAIPAHVPEELVVEFDMRTVPDGQEDMQLAWRKAVGGRPLVYTPYNGGCWIPTEAEDIEAFYPDVQRLSNHDIFIPSHEGERVLPGELDPPRHGQIRKAILSQLSASVIRNMEPRIRDCCVELIEDVRPKGRCEFISEFALALPISMFLELAGMPQSDKGRLQDMAERIARGHTVEIKEGGHKDLRAYLAGWIATRREKPSDDLISHILAYRIDGETPLAPAEVEGLAMGVFLGGLDTIASSLGFIGRFLAENPEARDHIRATEGAKNHIVDELLRRFSIVSLGRVVAEDFEHKGVLLKRGDKVALSTFLHGLDPKRFTDPEKVDFNRRGGILAFGRGAHGCPGQPLARAELRIFLEEWLNRIPDFDVDLEEGYQVATGQVLAFKKLPLRWPAETGRAAA